MKNSAYQGGCYPLRPKAKGYVLLFLQNNFKFKNKVKLAYLG